MTRKLLSMLLALALCLSLLPTAALADETGETADTQSRVTYYDGKTGETKSTIYYTALDTALTVWDQGWYYAGSSLDVNGGVTVKGTVNLILADGANLVIKDGLTLADGAALTIYAASADLSDSLGMLSVKNEDGYAVSGSGTADLRSGKLYVYSGSGRALEPSVKLTSGGGSREHLLTHLLDCTPSSPTIKLAEWWGKDIALSWFQLEPCGHSNYEAVKVDASRHKYICPDCGDTKTKGGEIVVDVCTFETNDSDYVDRTKPLTKEGHFLLCDKLCGNVSPTPTAHEATTAAIPTDDGKGHTQRCWVCFYTPAENNPVEQHHYDKEGICENCGFQPVARDAAGDLYESVNDALRAAADGGTVTLEAHTDSKELCEGVVFDCADKSVTLEMNGYTLTTSGNPTLTVENGTLKITGDATINQTGTSHDLAAPAVKVTGGTLIFDGKLTASGKPAVEVTNGTLRLKAGDVLNGGVSVEGSTAYANVNALLGEKLAFAKVGETSTIVKGDVTSISGDVTVVAHPHGFEPGSYGKYVCICGYTCPHNDFKDGKCTICGKGCAHTNVDENGLCPNCKTQMVAKIEASDKMTTYSTDFKAAMNAAEDGTTVTLLANIEWGITPQSRAAIAGDDKIVTLNLNGHTITGGWFDIGSDKSPTSCTLKIIGEGSHESLWGSGGYSGVAPKAALDLSDWEGGTISAINISDSSNYEAETREAAVIVGPKAGTIGKLSFGNNQLGELKKTKLSGGSFNEIWAADFGPVKLGELLADGYAYQNADGSYVEYGTALQGASICNVKVVKCPHADAKDGTCLYCGQTGILAMVGDTIYDSVSSAVAAWLANGGTLKLFDDYGQGANGNALDLISAKAAWLAIDLNGHGFYKDCQGDIKLGGGKRLTITDSSGKGTGVFGPVTADRGTLTLESGHLQGLKVFSDSEPTILLKGGKLTGISCPIPIFNLLPNGYALMADSGLPVDPTITIDDSKTYTVKDSTNLCISSQNKGSAAIGSDTIPFTLSLKTGDSEIGRMGFTWYIVKEDGTTQKLAATTSDVTPGADGVYTCNAANMTVDPNGWIGLEANKTYNVLCVVNGKTSDGTSKWQTPMRGFTLQTLPPSLENAEIIFAPGWQERTFWPDPDNHSVGKAEIPSGMGAYTVTLNGKKLTEGTDYQVISGNVATGIGTYDFTIEGIAPNYSGTKTAQWTVVPFSLGTYKISPTEKQYDGTAALPDGVFPGCFDPKSPYLSGITLREGTDYVVTDARFDTPDASNENKVYRYTVELKNPNYVFANGTKVQTWVYGVDINATIEITKADAPAAREGALEVINNHADTYTVDLSALLPKLESPKKYGEVAYELGAVSINGGYYDAAKGNAEVKDGKLILPIQAVATETAGNIGTIKVAVNSQNYATFDLTINVNAANKIVPTGAPTLSKTTLAWGEQLNTVSLSGAMRDEVNGKDVTGTFAWDGTNVISGIGKFPMTWTFTPDDGDAYTKAGGFSEITVVKSTPTGAPQYTAITTSGKTLTDAALTVDGGSFSLPGTVQWVDENGTELDVSTEVKANTAYRWRFVPEDSEHYNELTGTITLYTVSHSGGGGGGSTGAAGKTETVTNPNGSTTKTETKKDGTVIETTTGKDGSVSKTETKPDGSSVTENKAADGSTGTVKTDKNGQTTAETKVSAKAVEDAKANGEAVKAPVEVKAGKNSSTAPTIDIMLPAGAGETKVEIPVSNVSSGTVAIIVHPDGTEEIDKSGTVTETGVTVSVSGSATVKIVDNSKDFIDTRGHWSKDDVNFVAARELFNGVGNNRFGVGESMTRGMVNTVLARLAGVDTTPPSGLKWYEPGTAWAVSNGITDGTNLDGAVTREQLAAMLYRYAGSPEVSGSLSYDDALSASGYAQDALLWAAKMGVLNGVGGNRLAPKDGASREQVAAMLARYLKNA